MTLDEVWFSIAGDYEQFLVLSKEKLLGRPRHRINTAHMMVIGTLI
jgi:hypothetical protein